MTEDPVAPPVPAGGTITPAMQDYLKAVYRLGERGSVATQELADELGVAAPSVTNMAKRLHELGLLHHVPYQGVSLTAAGRAAALDVALLQHHVLGPLLAIGDVRTDKRIDFVGGARGTAALEKAVTGGQAAVAFAMHPVTIDDLIAISDEGGIMPPKSTWFEPKLRDGLLIHTI